MAELQTVTTERDDARCAADGFRDNADGLIERLERKDDALDARCAELGQCRDKIRELQETIDRQAEQIARQARTIDEYESRRVHSLEWQAVRADIANLKRVMFDHIHKEE
jgi:hypothetical protein